MNGSVRSFLHTVRRVWFCVIGHDRGQPSDSVPGVIVHDPDATKPQNLDNPFRDAGIQEEVGKLIARTAARERIKPEL